MEWKEAGSPFNATLEHWYIAVYRQKHLRKSPHFRQHYKTEEMWEQDAMCIHKMKHWISKVLRWIKKVWVKVKSMPDHTHVIDVGTDIRTWTPTNCLLCSSLAYQWCKHNTQMNVLISDKFLTWNFVMWGCGKRDKTTTITSPLASMILY